MSPPATARRRRVFSWAGDRERSSPATIAALGVVAYAACDLIHEVLGHGTAVLLSPDVSAVSLTTVALSTTGASRPVAAAGSGANVVAGLAALAWLLVRRGSGTARVFAWLLMSLDLLNAAAYPVDSAVLDYGDWAVVTSGLPAHAVWRAGLGLLGAAAYAAVVWLSAKCLGVLVADGVVRRRDLGRLAVVPYVTGGLLLVAGAALSPFGARLVLLSGASTGFGAMAGLLATPALAGHPSEERAGAWSVLRFEPGWVGAAVLVAVVFVFVVGPGIRLS